MKQKELLPKKRFKEFNNYWEEKSLEEVIEGLYNGQTPSRFKDQYWNGNINWLSSGELNKDVVTNTNEKITEEGRKAANLKVVPKNTFIMAITGLEAAGTRGNCAITGINTTLNQSCMAVYPKRNLLDTQFLFQWYRKIGELYGLKYTQGTKQQSYNAALVNKLKIILPSKTEQQKIGQFFKYLDNMISIQQKKIDKTKALKSAYLFEMFPSEGESLPKRRFEGFSDEWENKKLGEIGQTFNGLSGKTKKDFGHGTAEFITFINVFNNPISNTNLTENVEVDLKQNEVKYGDVLFTTSSETPHEVGMSSVWLDNRPNVYLNSFCFGYRINIELDALFTAYLFRTNIMRKQMHVLAQGISRYNISKSKVMETIIPLPSKKEQQIIGKFFKYLDDMITVDEKKLDKLKATKQAYLNEMFV